MTSVGWSLVAIAAQLLPRDEREAALGDLVEASESAWQGLPDVLGFCIDRRSSGRVGGPGSRRSDWRRQTASF
jgi:hypothetical protein